MDGANGLKGTTVSVNVFTARGKVGQRPRQRGKDLGGCDVLRQVQQPKSKSCLTED